MAIYKKIERFISKYFPMLLFPFITNLIKLSNLVMSADISAAGTRSEYKISWYVGNETSHQKWPKGIVKYRIGDELSVYEMNNLTIAFNEYHQKTCVKFESWNNEKDYVSIEKNETIACGEANVCKKGGYQYARFKEACMYKGTFIHELGHSLCLSHEQHRSDLYDYLSFDTCTQELKDKVENFQSNNVGKYVHKGIYDYASQMHYPCTCEGKGGIPTNENWKLCGEHIPGNDGLSVMDAEYINELYDCQGCHRHRWLPLISLGPNDFQNMYSFGYMDHMNRSLYPCRAMHRGEVAIGMYTVETGSCLIPSRFENRAVLKSDNAEVLMIPGGLTTSSNGDSTEYFTYELANIMSFDDPYEVIREAVPAGNGWNLDENWFGLGYIAFGALNWNEFEYKDNSTAADNTGEDYLLAIDQIGTMWDWKDGRKLEAVFTTSKGNLVSSCFYRILICKRSGNELVTGEEKPEVHREVTPVDCGSGCYQKKDGSCQCSIFEDY